MSHHTYYAEGKGHKLEERYMKASELLFWKDNPRIYESIRMKVGEELSQDDIKEFMLQQDSTKKLLKTIKKDGGVTDVLLVRKEDASQYVVYEGNTRLAIVKKLYLEGGIESEELKVHVIPEEMPKNLINAIIGRYHLTGKADWSAYETNSFLYREYSYMLEELDKSHAEAIKKLSDEFQITPNSIKGAIKTLTFMKENKLTDDLGIKKFSYWHEYTKSNKIQQLARLFNDKEKFSEIKTTTKSKPFDDFFIKTVYSDKCPKAVDVRDTFKKLHGAYEKDQKDPLIDLIKGKHDLKKAEQEIDETKLSVLTTFGDIEKKLRKADAEAISKELEDNPEMKKTLKYILNFLTVQLNISQAINEAERVPESTDAEGEKIIRMQESQLVERLVELAKEEYLPTKNFSKVKIRLMVKDLAKKGEITNNNYEDLLASNEFPEELKKKISKYQNN